MICFSVDPKLRNEFRLSLMRAMAKLRLLAKSHPDGTEAANGGMGDLVGVHPNGEYLTRTPVASYLEPAGGSRVSFEGRYPADFLVSPRPDRLTAWHLVGGKDPIDPSELTGTEPDDGYPVLLRDWIRRDGLTCLKVKLRGDDPAWDYDRLARVGRIAQQSPRQVVYRSLKANDKPLIGLFFARLEA